MNDELWVRVKAYSDRTELIISINALPCEKEEGLRVADRCGRVAYEGINRKAAPDLFPLLFDDFSDEES